MEGQLNKGIIEMCILYILSRGDSYGYSIMLQMSELFSSTDASVFYAILRRLSKLGYTNSYEGNETEGPPRRYHHITKEGTEYLNKKLSEWYQLCSIVKRIGI